LSEIQFRAHTDAVIALLEGQDLLVGDHEAPDGAGEQGDGSFVHYVVVYRIPGGKRSGTLADPHGDADFIYQVTCVGSSRRQAEWLADKAEALLAGVTVEGRRIHVVPHGNPGIPREDDVTPSIFTMAPRYRLMSSPA
jgi:hypothetical protein